MASIHNAIKDATLLGEADAVSILAQQTPEQHERGRHVTQLLAEIANLTCPIDREGWMIGWMMATITAYAHPEVMQRLARELSDTGYGDDNGPDLFARLLEKELPHDGTALR